MTEFNDIQSIKRRFFALRNGVIADTLRKGGSPYKIIFGLNLPQLKEIAAEIGVNPQIAQTLWENRSTRESRILAPMLISPQAISFDEAMQWIVSVDDVETADMLCHNLLRRLSCINELIDTLIGSAEDMQRYIALRLLWTAMRNDLAKAESLARNELARECRLTKGVAMQLIEEIDFLKPASC